MKADMFFRKKARINTVILIVWGILSAIVTSAQQPEAVFDHTFKAPLIDGIVDSIWAQAREYNIAQPFMNETPTLGALGETTWKGLWNVDGIYILVKVADDVFSPAYDGTDPNSGWMYDRPEIYVDCNYILNDGQGPNSSSPNGHYFFAPDPGKDQINGGQLHNYYPDSVSYSFNVNGSSYFVEYFIPFSGLSDRDGTSMDKTAVFGFDISINDNDSTTPLRNRMVWANTGAIDENWNNMDDAGHAVFLTGPCIPPDPIPISKITLTPGSISVNNGVLQMVPLLEPDWFYGDGIQWTVINQTGQASINPTGLVTAISDGTVIVKATSSLNPNAQATTTIYISGQSPVSAVDQLSDNEQLTIFPNPTSGIVKLIFSKVPPNGTYLTVMDVTGKTVLKQIVQNKEESIDLKGNPPGVYLIKTNLKDGKVQRVILK